MEIALQTGRSIGASLLFAITTNANALPGFNQSFIPDTIGPGSISTLTFTLSNPDTTPANQMGFGNALPSGLVVATPAAVNNDCSGEVNAAAGSTQISLSNGSLEAQSSCSIAVNVTGAAAGSYVNTTGDLTSSAGNSGSATATLTIDTGRPDFSKSFAPGTVFFGKRSTLTFTIDNSANASQVFALRFTDNLPDGMVVANPANASTTCTGGAITANPGSSVISYAPVTGGFDASVDANSACSLSVDVLGNAVGSLENVSGDLTGNILPSTPVNSGKAGDVLVVQRETLSIQKSFTNDPVAPGGMVNLQYSIHNIDRVGATANISFSDDLDSVLSGLSAIVLPADDMCGAGSQLSGTSNLSFGGGQLASGESCTFNVTLAVPGNAVPGNYPSTSSTVNSDNGSGQPASDILMVTSAPTLTKTYLNNPVGAGHTVDLEFSLTNNSATDSVTDIQFTDAFDDIIQSASTLPAAGFCGSGSTAVFNVASGFAPATLTISGANLPAAGSCTFTVSLDVAVGAPSGQYVNTTSEVTSAVEGEASTGQPATDILEVVGAPALSKEFVDDPVTEGGNVTLEFTITNTDEAPGTATAINFTDDLAAVISGLTATGLPAIDVCGIGSSLSGSTALTFSNGTLDPGASCTFSVQLTVPGNTAPGTYSNNTSSLLATVAGIGTIGEAASDDLHVAGLQMSKSFINDPVIPGADVTLQYQIVNLSQNQAAADIFFTDNLSQTVTGLVSTDTPQSDICGGGSTLTGSSGGSLLIFQGGTLGSGESCTFNTILSTPAGAASDSYQSTSSEVVGTFGGNVIASPPGNDLLTLSNELLNFSKEFTDDPVSPGDLVTLRFTLTNVSGTDTVQNISFTDDLETVLTGLANASGILTNVCGFGSEISGNSLLSFSGGTLAAGQSCSFDVSLTTPNDVPLGAAGINVTSAVTGTAGTLGVTGNPAIDTLNIDYVEFTKNFTDVGEPGGSVILNFSISNLSSTETLGQLYFSDDLGAVLAGLEATGTPIADVCGVGSLLEGSDFLTLVDASLLPGGSCTFDVDVNIPASATSGSYINMTSPLNQAGIEIASSAEATLTIIADVDSDGDGIPDSVDMCPETAIPEGVPTIKLGVNRYALIDNDDVFDTNTPRSLQTQAVGVNKGTKNRIANVSIGTNPRKPGASFTLTDTAGCSCEQIIDAQGLGQGHRKFGCSLGAMRDWVELVNP